MLRTPPTPHVPKVKQGKAGLTGDQQLGSLADELTPDDPNWTRAGRPKFKA